MNSLRVEVRSEVARRFKAACAREGKTQSQIMRELLEYWLEGQEEQEEEK